MCGYNTKSIYWGVIMKNLFRGLFAGVIMVCSFASAFGAGTPGTLKWTFIANTYTDVDSSPAIGADGTIYVGSGNGMFYAVNPDGTLKWSYQTGFEITSSPAVGDDGTIYVGSHDDNLYAFNPDGTVKWTYTTGGTIGSSPAVGSDGTIYFSSGDYKFYALNSDGTLKWSYRTPEYDIFVSSPAIGADGTIYVGSNDDNLYALNPDGTKRWSFTTEGSVASSPAIGSDGTIYVGSDDYRLYAINPNGTKKWSYKTEYFIMGSPAIGSDGTIYIGSWDNKLYAVSSAGSLKWSYPVAAIVSSPAVGSDGTIYVGSGSSDNSLYAINPNGELLWSYATESQIGSSPAIGSDGTLYFGSGVGLYGGALFAVNSASAGLASSSWPMFRRDARHTARITASAVPTLMVYASGTGTGVVTSAPSGIDCGATCTATFAKGTSVVLTARPNSGSTFSGWSGACSGTGSCTLTMNSDQSVGAAFDIAPQGTPKIAVSPSSVNVGTVKNGVPASKTLTIKNTGTGSLILGTLSLTGANASEFSASTTCGALAKNGTCTITVTLTAASFGAKSAILTIPSNAPAKPSYAVNLKGTCAPPKISVSPGSANFSTVSVGTTSKTKTITIKNGGTSDLVIDSIIQTGDSSFLITGNTCSTLTKGASCAVAMTFAPSTTGTLTGSLMISSNDPSKGIVTVLLKGKGK